MSERAETPPAARLRAELIHQPDPRGGLLLYDPLLERLHRLDPSEQAQLHAPGPELLARLQAGLLLEGASAQALRASVVQARAASPPRPAQLPQVAQVDWGLAEDLPDGVSPRWRNGEALRRKAEDRAAGRRVLVLDGFLAPVFLDVLEAEVRALPRQRLETELVRAERARVHQGLPALQEILTAAHTRTLLGAVLGVALPPQVEANAWHLQPGDCMGVHPDGPRYRATWALGLNRGWTAADGGAIAFGQPLPDGGFDVRSRWLPHRGDLCLFVPHATSWHQVEPPRRPRWTVTGWWVDR